MPSLGAVFTIAMEGLSLIHPDSLLFGQSHQRVIFRFSAAGAIHELSLLENDRSLCYIFIMADIKNKKLIVIKGILFLILGVTSALLVILSAESLQVALFLVLAIWAFCRFYYFLFHVLEKYVGVEGRYAGIGDLLLRLVKKKKP